MSTDLETRLRSALRPEPDPAVGARLRERVMEGFPPPRRRRLLPLLGRVVRPALALAGVGVLVTVMALLVIATPDGPSAATPQQTGVGMVLRPIPYDLAASPEDAAARLAQIMEAQREARGITGMIVTREGERVRVFVPRTHDTNWPRGLLVGLHVGIYDLGADSVVADRSLAKVLEAVELPPVGTEPSRYYAVSPAEDPSLSVISGPFATADEARVPEATRVARVPMTTALALDGASGGSFRFLALREPLIGPGSVATARAEGDVMILTVAATARAEIAKALSVADPADLAVIAAPGIPQVIGVRFAGVDPATGEVSFPAPRGGPVGEWASSLTGGGIDAMIAVEDTRALGPPPARTGERPAELPPHFRRLSTGDLAEDPFRPREDSVLRVLQTVWRGGTWSLWTHLPQGNDLELVTTIGPGDGAGSGGCPIAPDHPVLYVCGSGAGFELSGVGRTIHGRVGEGVASVTLVLSDGREFPAAVDNGFFLLILPPDERAVANFVVRDGAGALLGTFPENEPIWLPLD